MLKQSGLGVVRVRAALFGLGFLLIALISLFSFRSAANKKATDYETELDRIQKDISDLKESTVITPVEIEKSTKYLYRLYQRALLTVSTADFGVVESAIEDAIQQNGRLTDLCLLKANMDFRFHRLAETKKDLVMAPDLARRPEAQTLEADLDFQEGHYEAARQRYEAAIQKSRTWDKLARLGYLESKIGDVCRADELYGEAEDEITAKEMRSYAWVELQRGLLALSHGQYESALAHYTQASKAYSGYWLVDEYMAELLGAEGKFDQAVSLYESVIARAPRPEVEQALGDLYVFRGQPELARQWHEKALVSYRQSVQRGEVHYFHHLAGFYADVLENGADAVKWAHKDLELRPNFATYDALAWALYRAGQFADAFDAINTALSSGVKDAHIFCHAAMIYISTGRVSDGRQLLIKAREINPHYDRFHAHR